MAAKTKYDESPDGMKYALERLRKQVRILGWSLVIVGVAAITFTILYMVNRADKTLSKLQTTNSVEIVYESRPLGDSLFVITTHKKIHLNNNIIKSTDDHDTVPNPGLKSAPAYSENGSANVTVPKDYEFFVTIK